MSKDKKMDIIRSVESSGLSISQALKKLDMPRSTYYRWKQKLRTMGLQGLKDNTPHRSRAWNQLLPHEDDSCNWLDNLSVGLPIGSPIWRN